ncbi:MAG: sigma-70 family RNA polymerase sigma factor [Jatrophihabitans sp.]|nr:MAG: sigma-70 family RNA polymerase sigma factor [Jatrophihabitans sp.]
MPTAEADLIGALHEAHAGALRTFVLGLVGGDHARAQDVVQETFLRAWRSPGALGATPASARSWLFTVARHIVIDQWRAATRRPEAVVAQLPEAAGQAQDDASAQVVERQVMIAALRSLRAEHREVLVTCYYRGATLVEAAQLLEIPVGTVKSRLHHALRALRAVYEDGAAGEWGGPR